MHVVPPPMTGNYMPSGPDIKIDYSQFTYGPKQSQPSESDARSSDFNSCESNCSEETHESMPELVVNEPNVVSQPRVWSDAPIIEEYESDSEDEHVSLPTKEHEIPSFADKHVKTPKQTVIEQNTCSQRRIGIEGRRQSGSHRISQHELHLRKCDQSAGRYAAPRRPHTLSARQLKSDLRSTRPYTALETVTGVGRSVWSLTLDRALAYQLSTVLD
ncbi:hypothetical protein Tco_0371631 [Tanacetum coccineum]